MVIHPRRFRRYLEVNHGNKLSVTRDFFTGVFNNCLLGEAKLRVVLPPRLITWRWRGAVEASIETWLAVANVPDERILSVLADLRAAGYRCGLTTSQERNRADFMAREMSVSEIFGDQFYSCRIGFQKSEPQFYRYTASTLALSGSQVLFWDDAEETVIAARKWAGMPRSTADTLISRAEWSNCSI